MNNHVSIINSHVCYTGLAGLVTTFAYCCTVVDLTACIVNIVFICKSLWIKAFAKLLNK